MDNLSAIHAHLFSYLIYSIILMCIVMVKLVYFNFL